MSMKERIARAIDDNYEVSQKREVTNIDTLVVEVLKAMEVPSTGMILHACNAGIGADVSIVVWKSMITAALEGK